MKTSIVHGLSILLRSMPITPLIQRLVHPEKNLKSWLKPDNLAYQSIDEEPFVRACLREYPHYSENEARHTAKSLNSTLAASDYSKLGLFALIHATAVQMLRLDGDSVRCRHEKMVAWRETVHGIGQSPFLCAFLAAEDLKTGYTRHNYAFAPYAKTDNLRIRQMLAQGMSENHYHLKGSSPTFLLSWVCLMNHVTRRKKEFDDLGRTFFRATEEDADASLHHLTCQAAIIRLFFIKVLSGDNPTDLWSGKSQEFKFKDLLQADSKTLSLYLPHLQREINAHRSIYGKSLDYAISTTRQPNSYAPISGEHAFLYKMFHVAFRMAPQFTPWLDLFYAYLLIAIRLRSELVQSNTAVGFHNFFLYQDRKEIFVDNYKPYSDALLRIAHHSALDNDALRRLEARITPKSDSTTLNISLLNTMKAAEVLDRYACKECPHVDTANDRCGTRKRLCLKNLARTFYVLHLVKMQDKQPKEALHSLIHCRHHSFRKKVVKPTVRSIIRWRKGGNPAAEHVYGIDACNQEIGCRPEVFAPYFRYLREYSFAMSNVHLHGIELPIMRVTYHVGEDFLDVVDGLRAIDEAITFLELRHGDRLGHALALGISPQEWYAFKGGHIVLSRQDMLDNVVWLQIKLNQFGFSTHEIANTLRNIFREHFCYIYAKWKPTAEHLSFETYYEGWQLRGDRPRFYLETSPKKFLDNIKIAEIGELQSGTGTALIRAGNLSARKLMHLYHYCPDVRKRGAEIIDHQVSSEYIQAVAAVQKRMQHEIARKGLGIETNPSSNYLIGTFKRYDKHPILAFNNEGLGDEDSSPQLFVSINTDDQGVFDTDLENEFALMACALETAVDDDGNYKYKPAQVYRWLDNVRAMGLEQSFKPLVR